MNMIINDSDHPLIIKVASIQSARMQVYFIDNEDYFQKKCLYTDEKGQFLQDNDERAIFFCRGVLETVKKLGWTPDVIHCLGWMSSLIPMYVKTSYKDDPIFSNTKVVYSVYNNSFKEALNTKFAKKAMMDANTKDELKAYEKPTFVSLNKAAMQWADGVIKGSADIDEELEKYMKQLQVPVLKYQPEDSFVQRYSEFYDEVLLEEEVLAE